MYVETFRATAKYFVDDGEKAAIKDNFVALMVLQHYKVPTRLLDWTTSPFTIHIQNKGSIVTEGNPDKLYVLPVGAVNLLNLLYFRFDAG